jgi:hypothetical protein
MRARRAAAIVGGVALVGAWLSSAAGILLDGGREPSQPAVGPAATSGAETLAADVQAQAARLRDRLSRAPVPQPAGRNPFRFGARRGVERPLVRAVAIDHAPAAAAPPVVAAPPPLKLEGLAEREIAGAKKRTAVLSSLGGIVFALEGDIVEGRYRVVAIGTDVVELEDLSTGGVTRLTLR